MIFGVLRRVEFFKIQDAAVGVAFVTAELGKEVDLDMQTRRLCYSSFHSKFLLQRLFFINKLCCQTMNFKKERSFRDVVFCSTLITSVTLVDIQISKLPGAL